MEHICHAGLFCGECCLGSRRSSWLTLRLRLLFLPAATPVTADLFMLLAGPCTSSKQGHIRVHWAACVQHPLEVKLRRKTAIDQNALCSTPSSSCFCKSRCLKTCLRDTHLHLRHNRGARAIIMTDEKLRAKYILLLVWRVQTAVLSGTVTSLCMICVYLQTIKYSEGPGYCIGHFVSTP
jgi:hypothetical protein